MRNSTDRCQKETRCISEESVALGIAGTRLAGILILSRDETSSSPGRAVLAISWGMVKSTRPVKLLRGSRSQSCPMCNVMLPIGGTSVARGAVSRKCGLVQQRMTPLSRCELVQRQFQ